MNIAFSFRPKLLDALRGYTKHNFASDTVAGFTVGIVALPLAMAVRVFGSDNVLYGSDYPHTIGDPIGCLARVDRLPGGVRERVRGANAGRIFGFR